IDVCLQQFGLRAPPEIESRREPAPPEPAPHPKNGPHSTGSMAAPRRPSPTLAPHDPLTMDLGSLAPDIQGAIGINPAAGANHTLPAPSDANRMIVGKLVATCRSGLTASAKFIMSGGDAAPPADSSLSLRTSWSFERELRTGLRILLIAGVLGGG